MKPAPTRNDSDSQIPRQPGQRQQPASGTAARRCPVVHRLLSNRSRLRTWRALLVMTAPLLLCGCTSWFFYPMQPHVSTPAAFGYDYNDVYMLADDGTRLHGWLIEPARPALGSVYFLHGNAENISTHFRAVLWLVDAGYEVFALDYRGYGLSQGEPDVPEVFDDIEAGAQWLDSHVKREGPRSRPQYLYGQSLGGSLAITFAQRYPDFPGRFDGLIAEAAFSRFGTIARHVASSHWLTWSAQYPAQWLIGSHHDPLDAISQLQDVPKLLIHSRDDSIIPYRFGQELFAAAREPKAWISASGPHIQAAADPAVRQAILSFMRRHAHRADGPVLQLSGSRTDQ